MDPEAQAKLDQAVKLLDENHELRKKIYDNYEESAKLVQEAVDILNKNKPV